MRKAKFYTPSNEPVYLTPQGKTDLETELQELLEVRRPEIAATILAAREDGDLRENGAYHDAKDRQGHLEARIRLLTQRLDRAQIIEEATGGDRIELGRTVTVQTDAGAPERYTIVGSMEADVRAARISNESPLGKALLGHKVGDTCQFTTPAGQMQLTVNAIE
ncbi:MAG TPA: transcription elongation factor GreA [Chloroflexota bacterium]|nr:transcription elongation factor GreA [Chloroflexota bacterium]